MKYETVAGFFVIMLFVVSVFPLVIPSEAADSHATLSTVDWWPMFRHDVLHNGYSTTGAPITNSTLWSCTGTAGFAMFSSPAVAGGAVYVGSLDNRTYAFNASTGLRLWNYTTGGPVLSSPAVANGMVYVGSIDNKTYALNATNGALIWSYTTHGAVLFSSPTLAYGLVYIGSNDNNVYALDASTGARVWNYTTGGGVWSSPAVANDIVYVGSADGSIYALNAHTGALVWTYMFELGWLSGYTVASSPAVAYDTVFVGVSNTGGESPNQVYAFDASTGVLRWNYTTGGALFSSPAVAYGKVFVGSGDAHALYDDVYALDASTGVPAWIITVDGPVNSSPAVANSMVFIGSEDNKTYALDASTGAVIWTYETGNFVDSSPAVFNGVVYVGSNDGKLYAIGTQGVSTLWDPVRDSYSPVNLASSWSGGVCYGLSSTEVLYFMHYVLGNASCPHLPLQSPKATSTSQLVLPQPVGQRYTTLNNAMLAVMFHQCYEIGDVYAYTFLWPSMDWEYAKLLGALESHTPALLTLHGVGFTGRDVIHTVVAYGTEPLPNGTVIIKISDPNMPQLTEVAKYNPSTQAFSYGPGSNNYDMFQVTTAAMTQASWATPWYYFGTYWSRNVWLNFTVTGYNVVIANKMVNVTSYNRRDYFTAGGDSTSFVCGIPNTAGIEEGSVQVYAIPTGVSFNVSDPSPGESTLLIARVDNESGQPVGHGCLLNATATQGTLDYTVTPSDSGILISAGNAGLNANVAFFSATPENHSVFQCSTVALDTAETANFTVSNWETLNSTSPPAVTVTVSQAVPEFPTAMFLPMFMTATLLTALVWSRKRRRIC